MSLMRAQSPLPSLARGRPSRSTAPAGTVPGLPASISGDPAVEVGARAGSVARPVGGDVRGGPGARQAGDGDADAADHRVPQPDRPPVAGPVALGGEARDVGARRIGAD